MKCEKHHGLIIVACQWCGKQLCRECIAKTDGKKAYCQECSTKIGTYIQQKQLDQIKKEREAEKKQSRYSGVFKRY